MKLKNEIPFIKENFSKITNFPEYAKKIKANGIHNTKITF